MKAIAWLVLVGAVLSGICHLVAPSGVQAQSVEGARATLSRTEQELRLTIATAGAKAQELERRLERPDRGHALPMELQDFVASTAHLEALRTTLTNDIDAYDAAAAKKLEEFSRELAAINDPVARAGMQSLRRQAGEQSLERITVARAALTSLQQVLTQGSDVEHAANCVMIADELQRNGAELEARVRTAKETAKHVRARDGTTFLSRLMSKRRPIRPAEYGYVTARVSIARNGEHSRHERSRTAGA